MKKENWALGLSIVAMTIAIIATCIAAYRTPELGFDYQGVIVGILSLLVTVLIGWNIYTFIDIKGTSQKIDKFRAEFEGKIKKSSLETQFDVKKEMMRVVPILIARQHGDLISSLQFMFKAFHENKNLISHLINDMKGTLKVEEIEDFLHEFLSYSEEEKHQRYAGMQNVLLELLKAQS